MTREDFEHIAQCCHSLAGLVEDQSQPRAFTRDEFDRFIDRLIWAIHASPDGSPAFDHTLFVDRCNGKVN